MNLAKGFLLDLQTDTNVRFKKERFVNMIGEVIWYNPEKKYGFIKGYDFAENVFLHHSNLMCNEALMYPHQLVSFTETKEEKGWVAQEVAIPIGQILHGAILGVNMQGDGIIFTNTPSDRSQYYSFRRNDIKGIYSYEQFNFRRRRTEVLFQPRRKDHKKIAIDVWALLPQGWGTNVEIEEERGKQLIDAASSKQGYMFDEKVYVFKGRGISGDYRTSNKTVYKIGYSKNPESRLQALERQYRAQIEFVHEIFSDNAYITEQLLHVIFRRKGHAGTRSWEWFELEQADVEWLQDIFYVDCKKLRSVVRNELGMVGCEILFIGCRQ